MQQIANFIMSKKFIPILISLTAISVLLTFKSIGGSEKNDDPKTRHAKILKKVGLLIEEAHYSPKKMDDQLSKDIFKKFVETLDNEKCVFIKSDIESLKKYQNVIDDEIQGKKLESFYQISNLYIKRLNEIPAVINEVLSKPMNFNVDETVQLDGDKIDFTPSIKDRNEFWRKKIKYSVLAKFVDLQDERSKNKGGSGTLKADSTLEREARDIIRKQFNRFYNAKIQRENEEENFSVFINVIYFYQIYKVFSYHTSNHSLSNSITMINNKRFFAMVYQYNFYFTTIISIHRTRCVQNCNTILSSQTTSRSNLYFIILWNFKIQTRRDYFNTMWV